MPGPSLESHRRKNLSRRKAEDLVTRVSPEEKDRIEREVSRRKALNPRPKRAGRG